MGGSIASLLSHTPPATTGKRHADSVRPKDRLEFDFYVRLEILQRQARKNADDRAALLKEIQKFRRENGI